VAEGNVESEEWGHPWRQEIWIFGEVLVRRFEQVYQQLGWVKLNSPEDVSEK